MTDMPRPRPPHLQRETTRHGRAVWYVRVGKGPRIRLTAEYGTDDFDDQYKAAVDGKPLQAKRGPTSGSLQWLYERYRETGAWLSLAQATRRQRENIFHHVMEASGTVSYAAIRNSDIEAGKERRSATPSQARNFLDAMRGLFRWALKAGHVKVDPTAGVENPPRRKGAGFPEWTEEDVAAYERRWPIGTRQRVWLDVLLYTGGRRGDAHRIGRQHVRNGVATFRTEKTDTMVSLPILPVLRITLDAGPCGDLTFVAGARGGPLTKESFGNAFSEAARQAGVKKSAHGVRKIAATRCAENGATVHELNALFGWSGTTMAMLYTQAAERRRLALGAADKLQGTPTEHSIPAPSGKVRAS
jgi:integrase